MPQHDPCVVFGEPEQTQCLGPAALHGRKDMRERFAAMTDPPDEVSEVADVIAVRGLDPATVEPVEPGLPVMRWRRVIFDPPIRIKAA